MDNKKGQMGMDTARVFFLGLLGLIIIGIMIAITLAALGDVSLSRDAVVVTGEITSITGAGASTTGAAAYDPANFAVTGASNYTSGDVILAGNYTISSLGVISNASATQWNNVSLNYTYTTGNDIGRITDNGTSAMSTFFASTGTWLSLLGVVIIMLIIAVVVAVVNRFGNNRI